MSILKRRTVAACVLPAVAALALSACGSSSDNSSDSAGTSPSPAVTSDTAAAESTPATSDLASDPADDPATTAPSDNGDNGDAAAGSAKPIDINKTVTDPVMGEKFTVLKVIPDYPVTAAEKAKYSALEDETVVLVQVKVTASSKYYDSFGADSFYLAGDPGQGFDDGSTTILDNDIKAAGYDPLPDAETGKTASGWVVFTPKQGKAHLTLRYKRLAAGTSDGKTIAAKNFDVPLN